MAGSNRMFLEKLGLNGASQSLWSGSCPSCSVTTFLSHYELHQWCHLYRDSPMTTPKIQLKRLQKSQAERELAVNQDLLQQKGIYIWQFKSKDQRTIKQTFAQHEHNFKQPFRSQTLRHLLAPQIHGDLQQPICLLLMGMRSKGWRSHLSALVITISLYSPYSWPCPWLPLHILKLPGSRAKHHHSRDTWATTNSKSPI